MKTAWMLLITLLCTSSTRAEGEEELFRQCLSCEGADYFAAVNKLLGQPDAQNWVSNRMVRAEIPDEQRMAAVLFYRKRIPKAFEECSKVIAEICAIPDVTNRQSMQFWVMTPLLQFLEGREFEEEYGMVPIRKVEGAFSVRGPIRGLISSQNLSAYNAAARLALTEFYMKLGGGFNDYERIRMLECLRKIERNIIFEYGGKQEIRIFVKDLYKREADDEGRSLLVRHKAMTLLPKEESERKGAAAFRFAILENPAFDVEKDITHYEAVFQICAFFKDSGTIDDLAKLKTIKPPDEARQKFLQDTIQYLELRLEKQRTDEWDTLQWRRVEGRSVPVLEEDEKGKVEAK